MSEQSPSPPAGGWVIFSKLRSDLNKERVQTWEQLSTILNVWIIMRRNNTMPSLENIQATVTKIESDGLGTFRLYGTSSHPMELTREVLADLARTVGEMFEQNEVEFFVGGLRGSVLRSTTGRPPNVTLQ